jgi:hypothetical protein
MRRQSAPTNATPSPLARLDECPHRDAHLRSAARHCHPPITRPSFMSRLERIRTLPVVYGGNRAGLFVVLASSDRKPFRCRGAFEPSGNRFVETVQTHSFILKSKLWAKYLILLAPRAGFEPATIRLTVECSTAELPRNRRSPGARERQRITKPPRLAKDLMVPSWRADDGENRLPAPRRIIAFSHQERCHRMVHHVRRGQDMRPSAKNDSFRGDSCALGPGVVQCKTS